MKKFIKKSTATVILFCASNLVNASGLLVDIYPYYHELPKSVSKVCEKKSTCPEIEMSYLLSSKDWLNNIINQQINQFIAGEGQYEVVTLKNDEVQIPKKIKTALDNFAKDQIKEVSKDRKVKYVKSVQPSYLGHVGSLELFTVSGYDYLGGAHGVSYSFYQVIDKKEQKLLHLDDILLPKQKKKLTALVKIEFYKWLEKQNTNPKEHEAYWNFILTDNITFSAQGIKFLYQPYEIAAYSQGMPEFTVPYSKLTDVIKPEYITYEKQLSQ